jgi:hypothetical protein
MVKVRVGRSCKLRRIRKTYLWLSSLGALPILRTLLRKKTACRPDRKSRAPIARVLMATAKTFHMITELEPIKTP